MAKRNTFSEDEIYDEKFDINQVKRLFHYVKPYRTQIALIAVLMLSSSGLSMLIPTFFMKVMDDCIPMGMAGMKPILGYVAAILLITVYGMISLKLKIRYMSRIGQNIVHEIRSDIFNHLQELPFSYYDERPHGKIQVRVVNYVNNQYDYGSLQLVFYRRFYDCDQWETYAALYVRTAGACVCCGVN